MGKGGATGANLKQEEVMESMTKEIGMLKLKNQELNSVVLKVCYRACPHCSKSGQGSSL